ncbi:hypothetical protein CB0940_01384 [Cercospora beticola]|uniref:Uncharacterized protein n=1 Tax=Cercospora beticola TaxID=122368 RepID=A0A2G5I997_CERBT|nr:hypothetical protein CB0940_01384 [Cercospora beticola]PIB01084.1 hypothetical protein CB0940_01384 [Cercospora beticola]WPA96823.1 hypothetical protein RHO25_001431 [Cercospora beticola]CAK1354807.1 unnamed protein product [Cercospora beticola]
MAPQSGHVGLVLPLCTSAATVGLALYQYPVFLSFSQPNSAIAGKPLSQFWESMVKSGRALIAALALSSTLGGTLVSRWLRNHATLETGDVSKWYIAGSVLAAGHLAAVPLLAGPVQRIIAAQASAQSEEAVAEANRQEMQTWLTLHTARLLLIDLPALWCFAEGTSQAFWVGH